MALRNTSPSPRRITVIGQWSYALVASLLEGSLWLANWTMFNNWTMFFRLHKTQFWTTASLLCSTTELYMFFRLHKTQISTTAKADPITQTCAQPYAIWFELLQHGQFSFNRKCVHRYVIWFPLLHHVQFNLSHMLRCSSIGNVSTVDVNIWRVKGVRPQPCDIWFPLLQHEQFHISWIPQLS